MLRRLINNVRRGFATNSSSSHSLVYFKEPAATDSMFTGDNDYGWGDFTLNTLGEKLMYVLTTLVGQNYWNGRPSDEEVDREYEQYGHLFPEFDKNHFKYAIEGYVDHQSVGDAEALLPLARSPHVVIYGGNDNGGTGLENTLGHAGDAAEWGAYTDSPDSRVTPEQMKNDPSWRWNY